MKNGNSVAVQIRISGKDLGAMTLPELCEYCFWVKLRVRKLPYQIFPGIFSSIDSYSKRFIHACFDRDGHMPEFLDELGDDIKGYRQPPHFSKFQVFDEDSGVLLTGSPDGVLVRK